MKITLDVSSVPVQPAGAGRYIFELARGLMRREDLELGLISRRSDTFRWEAMGERPEVHGVAPDARPLRLAWEQALLPMRLPRMHADIHHAPHYTMPERSRVPVVVTIHDMTFFDHPEWHERSKVMVFRRAITQAVRRAAHLVAVSNDTAEHVRRRFGDVPMTVIPHGVDHARFHPIAGADDLDHLRAAGIPESYIVSVGTIEPRKNLTALIRSFDAIATSHPDLHLVIAGQRGWLLDDFDSTLANARHRDRIIVTGYVAESLVPPLLRHARAVAYPSLYEGFGLPALEAMACGVPVVAGKGSAVGEIVGEGALLVDGSDGMALTSGLEQALAFDRSEAARVGARVAARYTWDAVVDAHIGVYRSVTGS